MGPLPAQHAAPAVPRLPLSEKQHVRPRGSSAAPSVACVELVCSKLQQDSHAQHSHIQLPATALAAFSGQLRLLPAVPLCWRPQMALERLRTLSQARRVNGGSGSLLPARLAHCRPSTPRPVATACAQVAVAEPASAFDSIRRRRRARQGRPADCWEPALPAGYDAVLAAVPRNMTYGVELELLFPTDVSPWRLKKALAGTGWRCVCMRACARHGHAPWSRTHARSSATDEAPLNGCAAGSWRTPAYTVTAAGCILPSWFRRCCGAWRGYRPSSMCCVPSRLCDRASTTRLACTCT